jgi:hypothetical protein
MKRYLAAAAAALTLLAAVFCRPTFAAEGDEAILQVIPGDSLGVVIASRLADTTKRIEAVGGKLNLPVPSLLPMLKITTGLADGFDDRGTVAIAIVPQEDADLPPTAIVFVPVTDYGKLVASLKPEDEKAEIVEGRVAGKPVVVTQKGNFALFAPPSNEDVLKRVKADKTNIADEVKPVADWLKQNCVAALALPKGVQKAVDAMQAGLAKAKGAFPADRPEFRQTLLMFDLFDRNSQTIKDELTHFGIGVRIDDEQDFSISGQAAFKSGGKLSKAIADAKWPKLPGLDYVPGDDFFLAGSMTLPPSWLEGMMKASLAMAKLNANQPGSPFTEKQLEKMIEASQKAMQGMEGMALVVAPPDEGGSIFSEAVGVMYVDNAEKYLRNYQDTLKALGDLSKENENAPFPKYEFDEIEVAGEKGFQVKMDMSATFRAQNLNNPAAEAAMQKLIEVMYGPEGKMTVYLAPANKHTIAMTYSDKESLEKVIQAIKKREDGLGKDEDVIKSDKLLPAGTAWKMYISPAGTVELAKVLLDRFGQKQIELPDFPDTPPVAMGMNFTATGVEARLALPSETIEGLGSYIIKVRQMQGR